MRHQDLVGRHAIKIGNRLRGQAGAIHKGGGLRDQQFVALKLDARQLAVQFAV